MSDETTSSKNHQLNLLLQYDKQINENVYICTIWKEEEHDNGTDVNYYIMLLKLYCNTSDFISVAKFKLLW